MIAAAGYHEYLAGNIMPLDRNAEATGTM